MNIGINCFSDANRFIAMRLGKVNSRNHSH